MRSTIAATVAVALIAAAPISAQRNDPLAFLRPAPEVANQSFREYRDQPYRPVRTGEVRSAGFLTELRTMPFGKVLGPVTPPVVQVLESAQPALPGAPIAVTPPPGGAYQRGDTVMLARLARAPLGWGDIVVPTGLAVIGDHTPRQTVATIVAMYGPVAAGQVVLPLEPFVNPGSVQPVPISGPSGEVVVGREIRELVQQGGVMFINIGRTAGMRVGDFVEIHHRPGPRMNGADTGDDLMALAQVVHLGDKSSTIKMVRIIDPDIRSGAPVVRVTTLPN